MENGHLCAGLYWKEQKKKTAREHITPGGRAIKATGDDSMGVMQMIQAEKVTAAQRKKKGKVHPLQEIKEARFQSLWEGHMYLPVSIRE